MGIFDGPGLNKNDKVVVGNARNKFRDGFADMTVEQPNPSVWNIANQNSDHLFTTGGNSSGSSYLRISLNPFKDETEVSLSSKQVFSYPFRLGFGVSISQRIVGQEVFVGVAESDPTTGIKLIPSVADKPITGATATVASNVATFTLTNHGLRGGDRVLIMGCAEHRLNVGPVVVTVVTADTFTVPCTLGNASYSSVGGFVRNADQFAYANNGTGLLFENATATNASFITRRNGSSVRSVNVGVSTSAAAQSNTSPGTDAFNASSNYEFYGSLDEIACRTFASDSTSGMNSFSKWTQTVPDEESSYRIVIRAKNLGGMTKPVGRITNIAKSGTTTATVTTDVPHGLVAGDYVQVYGVLNQTDFPAQGAQTVVASAPTSTTFTVVMTATTPTISSSGGVVFKNEGSVLAAGVLAQAVASISRANNVLTLVGNTTWVGPLPGEYFQVHGLTGAAAAYEGAYKVLRVSGSTLELESNGADFGSIATGGAVFRRTDVRIHFARIMDYTRLAAEITGGKGNTNDGNNAVPVTVVASSAVSVNSTPQVTSSTTGALTRHRLLSAATTNATSVKTTAGRVYDLHVFNNAATVKFLKLYNKASAPTVGTDTPVETYPLAIGQMTRISFEDIGNSFSTGIAYAITGAIADNDTTAVAVNDVVVNMLYV